MSTISSHNVKKFKGEHALFTFLHCNRVLSFAPKHPSPFNKSFFMGDILILDNGAYTAKIGYASSDAPK